MIVLDLDTLRKLFDFDEIFCSIDIIYTFTETISIITLITHSELYIRYVGHIVV